MIAALATGWRRYVPAGARQRLRPVRQAYVDWRTRRPPRLGDLRRVTPIDANWGFERGTPIDRVYVERFVGAYAGDIRGRVLEIAAPDYTSRFGHDVTSVDILMAEEGNPEATIVGDLSDAPQIPDGSFDCAIVTQTLQFIYDARGALATLERILAPGGVLLATAPGLTKISPIEDAAYGEWWHYTARSLRQLGGRGLRRRERRSPVVWERPRRSRVPLRACRVRSQRGRARRTTTRSSRSSSGSEPSSRVAAERALDRRGHLAIDPIRRGEARSDARRSSSVSSRRCSRTTSASPRTCRLHRVVRLVDETSVGGKLQLRRGSAPSAAARRGAAYRRRVCPRRRPLDLDVSTTCAS